MSVLFFSFMTGSSIVNIPGPLIGYAKNGAWISLLLSITAGVLFLSCILFFVSKISRLYSLRNQQGFSRQMDYNPS